MTAAVALQGSSVDIGLKELADVLQVPESQLMALTVPQPYTMPRAPSPFSDTQQQHYQPPIINAYPQQLPYLQQGPGMPLQSQAQPPAMPHPDVLLSNDTEMDSEEYINPFVHTAVPSGHQNGNSPTRLFSAPVYDSRPMPSPTHSHEGFAPATSDPVANSSGTSYRNLMEGDFALPYDQCLPPTALAGLPPPALQHRNSFNFGQQQQMYAVHDVRESSLPPLDQFDLPSGVNGSGFEDYPSPTLTAVGHELSNGFSQSGLVSPGGSQANSGMSNEALTQAYQQTAQGYAQLPLASLQVPEGSVNMAQGYGQSHVGDSQQVPQSDGSAPQHYEQAPQPLRQGFGWVPQEVPSMLAGTVIPGRPEFGHSQSSRMPSRRLDRGPSFSTERGMSAFQQSPFQLLLTCVLLDTLQGQYSIVAKHWCCVRHPVFIGDVSFASCLADHGACHFVCMPLTAKKPAGCRVKCKQG